MQVHFPTSNLPSSHYNSLCLTGSSIFDFTLIKATRRNFSSKAVNLEVALMQKSVSCTRSAYQLSKSHKS